MNIWVSTQERERQAGGRDLGIRNMETMTEATIGEFVLLGKAQSEWRTKGVERQ